MGRPPALRAWVVSSSYLLRASSSIHGAFAPISYLLCHVATDEYNLFYENAYHASRSQLEPEGAKKKAATFHRVNAGRQFTQGKAHDVCMMMRVSIV